jgi:hypothetical protein
LASWTLALGDQSGRWEVYKLPRQVESDIEEVRRKRADVEARYEKRLEYLRARLKAAEIHERLLR